MGILAATTRALKNTISSPSSLIGTGIGVAFMPMDYDEKREEGHGKLYSAAYAVANFAFMTMYPMGYMAYEALTSAPGLAIDAYRWQNNYRRKLGQLNKQQAFQSASFFDTQETATMRQAGLAVLQRAQQNISTMNSAFGNQARFYNK